VLYRIVPTFSFLRAPSRFGLVVAFGLAVLASIGIAAALERVELRTGSGALAAMFIGAFAVAEAFVPLKFEPALQAHPAYRLLATLPDGPVVELPIYSRVLGFRRAHYMLDSTVHWKPLIDAYSDHIPPDFDARAEALADFPSLTAFADLKRDHTRYAVIHRSAYEGRMREELDERIKQFAPYLRLLAGDSNLLLFEIVRYP
jgi:hypothetical protein